MALTNLTASALGARCTGLQAPVIPDAEVLWISSNPVHDFTYPPVIDITGETPPGLDGDIPKLNFCNVSVALTHPGENDTEFISVWLPAHRGWNLRYTATGGGGIAAGYDFNMVAPLAAGFATSSSEAGLTLNHTVDPQTGTWALNEDGSPNEALFVNFGWRSIHDMSVVSKDLIKQFYGIGPHYSYWTGCSQGGRQGYAAAAKYPKDFDGILAASPSLGEEYVGPTTFWPVVVMHNEGEIVPSCVFDKYQSAIIEKCDPLDGAKDGLISDYDLLRSCPKEFDSSSLVGTVVSCKPVGDITITARHATIVRKILEGPRNSDGTELWFGTAPGANFSGVAGTVYHNGKWIPRPFPPGAAWLKSVIVPKMTDITKMSYTEFFDAFDKSVKLGGAYIGDEYLDLSAFKSAGGKLLSWVGLADQFIPPSHLLHFHDDVAAKLGGQSAVDDFYRVFTAPGVGHCGGGHGPQPVLPMRALVDWVERGKAPETLAGKTLIRSAHEMTRDLCMYPKRPVYKQGDLYRSASFTCEEPKMKPTEPKEKPTAASGESDGKDSSAGALRAAGWWYIVPCVALFVVSSLV
ncbi:uncharacterized protein APUU_20920S [Aspergillus puulaauensis]|uniref:Carboxylic ester hydrolase n=1 Tax=Aspergillus puulaauensis TaxID=1220207 RepID=A0A7R7XFY8_9EURO|nr:uncharacterized protein APUU_20920S [Aspergillus puulaauensis]BCS20488.1 hypothetical protein APUU_20920S [Aspergillus puulaauensis]